MQFAHLLLASRPFGHWCKPGGYRRRLEGTWGRTGHLPLNYLQGHAQSHQDAQGRAEAREQEHEARRLQLSLSPQRGPRLSNLSLERFRMSIKYQDRPAAADIAFCVAAYANGMTDDRIERALKDNYLSRDPSPTKRAAYIRRTMEKARRWTGR